MARPLRKLYTIERMSRRRHRTWMMSMTLATLALGVWCAAVLLVRIVPSHAPSFTIVFLAASLFAVPGFVLALLTLRAKLSWLLFASVPLFANLMLMFLPWLVHKMRNS